MARSFPVLPFQHSIACRSPCSANHSDVPKQFRRQHSCSNGPNSLRTQRQCRHLRPGLPLQRRHTSVLPYLRRADHQAIVRNATPEGNDGIPNRSSAESDGDCSSQRRSRRPRCVGGRLRKWPMAQPLTRCRKARHRRGGRQKADLLFESLNLHGHFSHGGGRQTHPLMSACCRRSNGCETWLETVELPRCNDFTLNSAPRTWIEEPEFVALELRGEECLRMRVLNQFHLHINRGTS